jgi:diketogulonate reductase-like aldo/keto reductase
MSNHFNTQIGFGTSGLGDSLEPEKWKRHLAAMQHAIEVGYKVFDTAEMYGDGKTELLLGQALKATGKRDSLHIVSKVLPKNATTVDDVIKACQASIRRMGCDYIDTYLLHWREGPMSINPAIEAMLELKQKGLIKSYGVSNFRKFSLEEWQMIERQLGVDSTISTHQLRYAVTYREHEKEVVPWNNNHNITTMAWGPLGKGAIFKDRLFVDIAQRYGYLPAQLAIAWTIKNPNFISIPKATDLNRIEKNLASQKLTLNDEILSELEKKFPIQ